MMMTWRRPDGKQDTREGECVIQQENAWMTIEQVGTNVYCFIVSRFLNNTASRRIIQDGRSQKFYFGEFGHLDFLEQFVETVDYAREASGSEANVDYLGLRRVIFVAYPLKPSDSHR